MIGLNLKQNNVQGALRTKDYNRLIEIIRCELNSLFGLSAYFGAELEFYLEAKSKENLAVVLDELAENGLKVDREKGLHQFEWVTEVFSEPLTIIKHILDTKKFIARVAARHGLRAIFSAKPFKSDYGSALHLHLTLHNKEGINQFMYESIENNLLLKSSVAGLLDISAEGMLLLCKSEGAFRRNVPGFMSPTFIAWGGNNRTTLVRIPDTEMRYRRIEYRLAPADANPYALFFLCLFGILNGLKNDMSPPNRVFGNAFDPQYKLEALPSSLDQAKKIFYNRGKVASFIQKNLTIKSNYD